MKTDQIFDELADRLQGEAYAIQVETPRRERLLYESQAWRTEARLIRIREYNNNTYGLDTSRS